MAASPERKFSRVLLTAVTADDFIRAEAYQKSLTKLNKVIEWKAVQFTTLPANFNYNSDMVVLMGKEDVNTEHPSKHIVRDTTKPASIKSVVESFERDTNGHRMRGRFMILSANKPAFTNIPGWIYFMSGVDKRRKVTKEIVAELGKSVLDIKALIGGNVDNTIRLLTDRFGATVVLKQKTDESDKKKVTESDEIASSSDDEDPEPSVIDTAGAALTVDGRLPETSPDYDASLAAIRAWIANPTRGQLNCLTQQEELPGTVLPLANHGAENPLVMELDRLVVANGIDHALVTMKYEAIPSGGEPEPPKPAEPPKPPKKKDRRQRKPPSPPPKRSSTGKIHTEPALKPPIRLMTVVKTPPTMATPDVSTLEICELAEGLSNLKGALSSHISDVFDTSVPTVYRFTVPAHVSLTSKLSASVSDTVNQYTTSTFNEPTLSTLRWALQPLACVMPSLAAKLLGATYVPGIRFDFHSFRAVQVCDGTGAVWKTFQLRDFFIAMMAVRPASPLKAVRRAQYWLLQGVASAYRPLSMRAIPEELASELTSKEQNVFATGDIDQVNMMLEKHGVKLSAGGGIEDNTDRATFNKYFTLGQFTEVMPGNVGSKLGHDDEAFERYSFGNRVYRDPSIRLDGEFDMDVATQYAADLNKKTHISRYKFTVDPEGGISADRVDAAPEKPTEADRLASAKTAAKADLDSTGLDTHLTAKLSIVSTIDDLASVLAEYGCALQEDTPGMFNLVADYDRAKLAKLHATSDVYNRVGDVFKSSTLFNEAKKSANDAYWRYIRKAPPVMTIDPANEKSTIGEINTTYDDVYVTQKPWQVLTLAAFCELKTKDDIIRQVNHKTGINYTDDSANQLSVYYETVPAEKKWGAKPWYKPDVATDLLANMKASITGSNHTVTLDTNGTVTANAFDVNFVLNPAELYDVYRQIQPSFEKQYRADMSSTDLAALLARFGLKVQNKQLVDVDDRRAMLDGKRSVADQWGYIYTTLEESNADLYNAANILKAVYARWTNAAQEWADFSRIAIDTDSLSFPDGDEWILSTGIVNDINKILADTPWSFDNNGQCVDEFSDRFEDNALDNKDHLYVQARAAKPKAELDALFGFSMGDDDFAAFVRKHTTIYLVRKATKGKKSMEDIYDKMVTMQPEEDRARIRYIETTNRFKEFAFKVDMDVIAACDGRVVANETADNVVILNEKDQLVASISQKLTPYGKTQLAFDSVNMDVGVLKQLYHVGDPDTPLRAYEKVTNKIHTLGALVKAYSTVLGTESEVKSLREKQEALLNEQAVLAQYSDVANADTSVIVASFDQDTIDKNSMSYEAVPDTSDKTKLVLLRPFNDNEKKWCDQLRQQIKPGARDAFDTELMKIRRNLPVPDSIKDQMAKIYGRPGDTSAMLDAKMKELARKSFTLERLIYLYSTDTQYAIQIPVLERDLNITNTAIRQLESRDGVVRPPTVTIDTTMLGNHRGVEATDQNAGVRFKQAAPPPPQGREMDKIIERAISNVYDDSRSKASEYLRQAIPLGLPLLLDEMGLSDQGEERKDANIRLRLGTQRTRDELSKIKQTDVDLSLFLIGVRNETRLSWVYNLNDYDFDQELVNDASKYAFMNEGSSIIIETDDDGGTNIVVLDQLDTLTAKINEFIDPDKHDDVEALVANEQTAANVITNLLPLLALTHISDGDVAYHLDDDNGRQEAQRRAQKVAADRDAGLDPTRDGDALTNKRAYELISMRKDIPLMAIPAARPTAPKTATRGFDAFVDACDEMKVSASNKLCERFEEVYIQSEDAAISLNSATLVNYAHRLQFGLSHGVATYDDADLFFVVDDQKEKYTKVISRAEAVSALADQIVDKRDEVDTLLRDGKHELDAKMAALQTKCNEIVDSLGRANDDLEEAKKWRVLVESMPHSSKTFVAKLATDIVACKAKLAAAKTKADTALNLVTDLIADVSATRQTVADIVKRGAKERDKSSSVYLTLIQELDSIRSTHVDRTQREVPYGFVRTAIFDMLNEHKRAVGAITNPTPTVYAALAAVFKPQVLTQNVDLGLYVDEIRRKAVSVIPAPPKANDQSGPAPPKGSDDEESEDEDGDAGTSADQSDLNSVDPGSLAAAKEAEARLKQQEADAKAAAAAAEEAEARRKEQEAADLQRQQRDASPVANLKIPSPQDDDLSNTARLYRVMFSDNMPNGQNGGFSWSGTDKTTLLGIFAKYAVTLKSDAAKSEAQELISSLAPEQKAAVVLKYAADNNDYYWTPGVDGPEAAAAGGEPETGPEDAAADDRNIREPSVESNASGIDKSATMYTEKSEPLPSLPDGYKRGTPVDGQNPWKKNDLLYYTGSKKAGIYNVSGFDSSKGAQMLVITKVKNSNSNNKQKAASCNTTSAWRVNTI
jgi:hypothetical protein